MFVWPVSPDFTKIYSKDYFSGAKDSLGYADYEGDREITLGVFKTYLENIDYRIFIRNRINYMKLQPQMIYL